MHFLRLFWLLVIFIFANFAYSVTGTLGKKSINSIVPLQDSTQRTKTVSLSVSDANWTTAAATGIAYADSDDNWWFKFSIDGNYSAGTTVSNLTISGVTFKDSPFTFQSVSAWDISIGTNVTNFSRANSGTGVIQSNFGFSATHPIVIGNVALESKPTWADANMEGKVDSSVYIFPASVSVSGVVDTQAQSFAGVKTYTNGLSFGNEAITDYDVVEVELDNEFTAGELTVRCVRVGDTVTCTCLGIPTNPSNGEPESSAGVIPVGFRPMSDAYNVWSTSATRNYTVMIDTGGKFQIFYRDWTGAGVADTTPNSAPSLTYNIP